MKKLFFSALMLISLLVAICSCGECKHQWAASTCVFPSECSLCGVTQGEARGHVWENPTCTEPKTCSQCKLTEGDALGHSYSDTVCESTPVCTVCNQLGQRLEHTWTSATCTSPMTCSACGTITGSTIEHNWSEPECNVYAHCLACDAVGAKGQHQWIEASCQAPRTCERCNESIGAVSDHTWVQISCSQPISCSVCRAESDEPTVHQWVFNGCLEKRTCRDCSIAEAEAPGHKLSPATCYMPSVCTVCKEGMGRPLGHDWVEVSCAKPKHCSRCELTEGVALEHSWSFLKTVPPSCVPGKKVYACDKCDAENEIFNDDELAVNYHICDNDGLCQGCNITFDTTKLTLTSIVVSGESYTVRCGIFSSPDTQTGIYKTITPDDIGMPIVDLNGDISKATKNEYISIPLFYSDGELSFECIAEMKIQGASSAGYAKKNYSIKLYEADGSKNKVELSDGWGKEFKYCMKANWVDYSQARNVVSGQLYGDVIDSRHVFDELSELPNGGAIDGFPILVFNNGKFHGIYTMNIPKDKWMFDMKDSDEKNQAIVMGEHWGNSVAMKEPIYYNASNPIWTGSSNWELEYASNEDSTVDNSTLWVVESLNNLINFVIQTKNDDEAFRNGIENYADIDKCIDSMLHTFFICADDNVSKNVLWVTFDGTHWFSSVYDMDGTWGLRWNGQVAFDENHLLINNFNIANYNLLWQRLYKVFYSRFVARYWELRQDAYSIENIEARFTDFFDKIPEVARVAERQKWTGVPSQTTNHLEQILDFARKRIAKMDEILAWSTLQ